MGITTKLTKGGDGHIRTATVRLANSRKWTRSINLLLPLEVIKEVKNQAINDPNLEDDDENEKQPRGLWKMGITTKLTKGGDGHIRTVTVLLANSRKWTRSINLLLPLEVIKEVKNQAINDPNLEEDDENVLKHQCLRYQSNGNEEPQQRWNILYSLNFRLTNTTAAGVGACLVPS
ncbi:unnamed protein product [Gongylonema pulchrum]|uniref:DUF5641 domain-containing protein n=1 Tax=Gongylonema pulchrum TaxID=637853 RepID=A0A183DSP5_9BILA|nr:unnamed protein product [Gongylonema pulchrum]